MSKEEPIQRTAYQRATRRMDQAVAAAFGNTKKAKFLPGQTLLRFMAGSEQDPPTKYGDVLREVSEGETNG